MDQSEFSAHLEEMERVAARQKAARFIDHRPVGVCLNCGAMKIICYRAKRGTVLDRLIGWLERSAVSHVEIVEHASDSHWYVIGCHIQRGGVSRARINKSDDWVELSLDLPAGQDAIAKHIAARLLGTPYAIHKLPRTRWRWWPTFGKGLICTSFIATCLELPDPDSWGIADLLDLAFTANMT